MNRLASDPSNNRDRAFFARVENLRVAVNEILPETKASSQIEELCRKLTASYREVRSFAPTKRGPIVVVVTESLETRRWVVKALRCELSDQVLSDGEHPADDLDGFGPIRPDWFPRKSRFESINSDYWNGANSWSCLGIHPSEAQRVDADLILYFVKFEDLQTDAAVRSIIPLSGIPIVPIVLNVTGKGGKDVRAYAERLEAALIKGTSLPHLDFPDFDDKRTTSSKCEAEKRIWDRCQSLINVSTAERCQVQEERCEAIRRRLDSDARNILRNSDFEQVNHSIRGLLKAEKSVLQEQTMKWVAGSDDLRIPIRIRLRLIACEIVPSLCFPFRSLLGVLALTTGVWDRVAMAMLGSPVALALTAYQSGGQLWKSRNSLQELSMNAGQQFSRSVISQLSDVLSETRRTITNRLPGSQALCNIDKDKIHVRGTEILLQEVRSILNQECCDAVSNRLVLWASIFCTIFFTFLVSGPIIALYDDYVRPLINISVLIGHDNGITSFPLPELGRIFTGFILGVIPGIIAGMMLLAYLTRKQVIKRLTGDIYDAIHDRINTMIKEQSLTLEGLDDSFGHIRFLNAIVEDTRSK